MRIQMFYLKFKFRTSFNISRMVPKIAEQIKLILGLRAFVMVVLRNLVEVSSVTHQFCVLQPTVVFNC